MASSSGGGARVGRQEARGALGLGGSGGEVVSSRKLEEKATRSSYPILSNKNSRKMSHNIRARNPLIGQSLLSTFCFHRKEEWYEIEGCNTAIEGSFES